MQFFVDQNTFNYLLNQITNKAAIYKNNSQVGHVDEVVKLVIIQKHSQYDGQGANKWWDVINFIEFVVLVWVNNHLQEQIGKYCHEDENSLDLDILLVVDQEENHQNFLCHFYKFPVVWVVIILLIKEPVHHSEAADFQITPIFIKYPK